VGMSGKHIHGVLGSFEGCRLQGSSGLLYCLQKRHSGKMEYSLCQEYGPAHQDQFVVFRSFHHLSEILLDFAGTICRALTPHIAVVLLDFARVTFYNIKGIAEPCTIELIP
jgi:hypothetical protein